MIVSKKSNETGVYMKKRYFVLLSCLCAVLFTGCSKGPSETFESFVKALENEEYEKAFNYVSESSLEESRIQLKASLVKAKAFISMMPAEAVEQIVKMEELANGSAEDFFAGMMKMAAEESEELFVSQEILKEEIKGDTATLWHKDEDGKEDKVELVKEGGKWVMLFTSPQE